MTRLLEKFRAGKLDPEKAAQLYKAIRTGDAETVLEIAKSFGPGAKYHLNTPIAVNGGANTLFLLEAVRGNDLSMVRILLNHGARPETRTGGATGTMPLDEPVRAAITDLMRADVRQRLPADE